MTRWLDDEEQPAWRAFVAASRYVFDQLDRQLQSDAGMPHAYYEILVRLSDAPGHSMRMSELAALTGSSRSRLSHAVARLEERGWVRRTDCLDDRRGQLAVLTDAGFAALRSAAPGHVGAVRAHVLDRLSPTQIRQLRRISEAVLAGGDPEAGGDRAAGHGQPGGRRLEHPGGDVAGRGNGAAHRHRQQRHQSDDEEHQQ
jgi:DNA-binding MarR family transcriptional regulator